MPLTIKGGLSFIWRSVFPLAHFTDQTIFCTSGKTEHQKKLKPPLTVSSMKWWKNNCHSVAK